MVGPGAPGVFAAGRRGSCPAGARQQDGEGARKGRAAASTLPEVGRSGAGLQVGRVSPQQQTHSSQIKQLMWHWDREQTAPLGTVCPDTGQLHN